MLPVGQHFLHFRNRLGRIQALGAGAGAIHDRMATVEPERIFQVIQSLTGGIVPAIHDPAVRLQQGSRTQVTVTVPPVTRTSRTAARAKDAFVHAVELGTVLLVFSILPGMVNRRLF